jgi:hypothetical protein
MTSIIYFKQSIKIFELLASITGLIYWNKWKGSFFKWMPVYLIILFIVECIGHVLAIMNLKEINNALYNYIGLPLESLFFCWFYYKCLHEKTNRLALFCAVAFIISWIIEQFFITQQSAYYSSLSYGVGNLGIVTLTTVYLIQLSLSDEVLHYKTNPAFWITIGAMIFYLGTFPYYGLFNLLAHKFQPIHYAYTWVMIFLNYSMYIIFAAVFIWSKPK